MASAPVDQDQQWLLSCLTATLDVNHDVRTFAEASLHQASLQPGFGAALARVAVNKEVPFGLRQLAAVLLKQFIKQHWKEDEEAFVHPVASPEEKDTVRQLLLFSLDDPHGKIRTAVGMAVVSIAHYDWPEDWSDLLPFLLKLISEESNMGGVRGALRCLALLSDDLDDTTVPKLVPILFPQLHRIVSSPNCYENALRAKALSIVHSCTSVLGSMSGVYKTETKTLMTPMLKSWMEQFAIILQSPVHSEDPDDWSIRMEVLKCLIQFVQNFPSLTEAEFAVIVQPLWQTFVSCLRVYQLALIQGVEDPYSGRFDSDGAEIGLESFVIQLFELLLTIVGNSRLAKIVGRNVSELVVYSILFLQMTDGQVHTWSIDANQYVADEDDVTYSCRVSGSLLLEEIINAYGREGINSVIEAAQKHYNESSQAKLIGSADWWRIREASIFALCSVSDQLLEAQDSGLTRLNLGDLLHPMLVEDIGTGLCEFPFLHARVFSAVAKFFSVINHELRQQFLYGAIQAVALDVPPPVKVGACRALSQLLPESDSGILQPQLMRLFSSLTDLLKQASDETLHLVLETLQAAVRAGREHSSSIEPVISPIILNAWVQHVSDPFISIDAVELLEAIKKAPGCMEPLVSRVLPYIGSVMEKPQLQPTGLVAGSLDLLTMLLKNAPADMVKVMFDHCFKSVIHIILRSDDHGEIQNATQCLAAFVSGGKQELLSWGRDPGTTMKSLLDAASRLLDPGMESSGSLFVGSYILQLILHLPSQMSLHIRELIGAVVRRMQSCEIEGLKSSLIVIIARLVHLSVPNVDQFVNLLLTLPAEGHENSLEYIMSEWTKLQPEIQGAYQIKVTTTALALLLATRHVELAKISVQGHLIKSYAGIVTRSKARLAPDQWTVLPLPAKIFSLLSDSLVEIQEQVSVDNDEDSEWEEGQESDGNYSQDMLLSATVQSNVRPSVEHLNAMAQVFGEDDGDNFEHDLIKGVDPLNEISLPDFLTDLFVNLHNGDKIFFDHLFQNLTQAQKDAVKTILGK